jgi:hypothetical protein
LSGGTLSVAGAVSAGQTIRFVAGGDVALSNLAAFGASIGGFAAGATIDLGGFAYSATEARMFTEAVSHLSGTLTVTDGARTAHLALLGNYTTSQFALSTDGAGGTFVRFA